MLNKVHIALAVTFMAFCSVALLPGTTKAGEHNKSETVPLDAQPQELVRHTVWDHTSTSEPQFLPAVVLREEDGRGLSAANNVVESLESYLQFLRSAVDRKLECEWSSENHFSIHESVNGRTMRDVLDPQSLVARGRVRAVVPGWSLSQTMTMVYVEVEEILHCGQDSGRHVPLGAIVAGTVEVGSFELDGLTVCTREPEGFIMPKVGEEVVVGGWPQPQDPYFIGHRIPVFPVRDEMVLPQPYSNFKWNAVSLASLRDALNGPHSYCEEDQ